MKDEEMAEKKYCKGCKLRMEQCLWAWRKVNGLNEPNEKNCSCKEVPAFFAGLKAGRPQWHDLRKNKNDLPRNGRIVSDQEGNNVKYVEHLNEWFYRHITCKANVIAWCEIPTFDKE